MAKVVVNVLSPWLLTSKEQGRRILQLWLELIPDYAPEYFNNYEPIRNEFSPKNIEAALDLWDWPFLVKRRKPRMDGGIYMGGGPASSHGWIIIGFELKPKLVASIENFFKRLVIEFGADFGFMHLEAPKQRLAVTTRRLREGIPDIFWATVFGKPYVDLFGRDRLLNSPALIIEELSANLFYLQVSNDILDIQKRTTELIEISDAIKAHLNSNAFVEPTLGPDHQYSVPEFCLRKP